MINRRHFISQTSAAIAGIACSPFLSSFNLMGKGPEIGLILGTVREPMKEDWQKTIEEIAATGYRYLEFGSPFGDSKETCKKALKRLRLKGIAGGGAMKGLQTNLPERIEHAHYFDQKYVVCYWPWSDDGKNKKIEDFKRLGDQLNELGKKCKAEGLTLAYHNHDIEFLETEKQIPYDTILQYTDPELVTMEIDLYWINKGNADPIEYFKKYPGRFSLCHVKDMDASPERGMACVGEGILDFPEIFSYSEKAGLKYYIVEHDNPVEPIECIKKSYAAMKNYRI